MSPLAERILERMTRLDIKQAELARAIGVSQQAVGKLVSGKTRSTSHIAEIAEFLQTTPAYLRGATDDPDLGASPPPPKPNVQIATMQVLLPDTLALEQMFLGILRASEGLSLEQIAHELALLLPKGLGLLRGPYVFVGPAPDDARPSGPADVSIDHHAQQRA